MNTHVALNDLEDLLLAAKNGDGLAKEQIASWMITKVQSQVERTLRFKRGSLSHSSLISHVLVRLVRGDTIDRAPNVPYLIASIARASRELLIDHYRRVSSTQRRMEVAPTSVLPWFQQVIEEQQIDLKELDDALEELEKISPRRAAVINLRFFCEMPAVQVARNLGISKSTVESDLRLARAWLFLRLGGEEENI
jgi:RNA polymerase sigma factor (TIGR02999 family)